MFVRNYSVFERIIIALLWPFVAGYKAITFEELSFPQVAFALGTIVGALVLAGMGFFTSMAVVVYLLGALMTYVVTDVFGPDHQLYEVFMVVGSGVFFGALLRGIVSLL